MPCYTYTHASATDYKNVLLLSASSWGTKAHARRTFSLQKTFTKSFLSQYNYIASLVSYAWFFVKKLAKTSCSSLKDAHGINYYCMMYLGNLTQLYLIGNSLRREARNDLAVRTFEVALIANERSKSESEFDSNETLKMKLHFGHSQCLQLMGRVSIR